tara:strand:+ start:136 stop:396 length:261 start_codon:yes stop_codon:yes gene_type:complete
LGDLIVLNIGAATNDVGSARVISNFEDGSDSFILTGILSYGKLLIKQGSGEYANDSIISVAETSEILAVVSDTNSDMICSADFGIM